MEGAKLLNFVLIFCALFIVFEFSLLTAAQDVEACPSPVCSCLGAHVDCSKRRLTSVPDNLPSWTENLELQGNQISNLTTFPTLPNLKKLDLSGCGLKSINKAIFGNMLALESLSLRHNLLTEIPADFRRLRNLTRLDLRGNDIAVLKDDDLHGVKNLEELDLGKNGLRSWPQNPFGGPARLKTLLLDGNRIFLLTNVSFTNLTLLETLKISKNRLQHLSQDVFKNLGNLTTLDLNRNRIKRLDGLSFRGLTRLRTLRLNKNGLRRLEDGTFWGLEYLKELQLRDNRITAIGKGWLYGMTFLQRLYLSNNEISQMDSAGWNYCKNLNVLDLSRNRFQELGGHAFSVLRNLEELFLNNNLLESIRNDSFVGLDNLRLLDLSNNQLSSVVEDTMRPFSHLGAVQEFRLANNELKTIPARAFRGMESVTSLDLTKNPITTLNRNSFAGLDGMAELFLNTTSLLCDCNLDWLKEWLETKRFPVEPNQLVCGHPKELAGFSVLELPQANLTCEDTPKPILVRQPQDTVGLQGGNTSLECVAKASGAAKIAVLWKRDNQVLYEEEGSLEMQNSVTRLDGGFVEFRSALKIWFLRQEDTAEYQCVIANRFGTGYSQKATLTVNVFPSFLKQPENVVIPVGGTARLECAALGYPAPSLSWRKDGGDDFPAARQRRMHVMPTDDVFFIVNVQLEDSGMYTCRATNEAGEATTDARVTVVAKPGFQNTMKDAMVSVGATHPFQCMVAGSPRPQITWYFNDQIINSDTHRQIPADNPQILVLVNVKQADDGVYRCKVTNQLGSSRQEARLTVTGDNFESAKVDPRPPRIDISENPDSESSEKRSVFTFDPASTPGIVIIAVVSCIVVTSLIWVLVIWYWRSRRPKNSDVRRSDSANQAISTRSTTAQFSESPDISRPVQVARSDFGAPMETAVMFSSLRRVPRQPDARYGFFAEEGATVGYLNDAQIFAPSGSSDRRRRKVFKVVSAPNAPSATATLRSLREENNLMESLLPHGSGEVLEMTSSDGSDDVTMHSISVPRQFYRPQTSSLDSGVGVEGPHDRRSAATTPCEMEEGRFIQNAGTLPTYFAERTAPPAIFNRSPSPKKKLLGVAQQTSGTGEFSRFSPGRSGSPAFWGERKEDENFSNLHR